MLGINLLKWTLVLLLFVALPIALMRLMVYKTIEIQRRSNGKQ
jgi:hypothetical protein